MNFCSVGVCFKLSFFLPKMVKLCDDVITMLVTASFLVGYWRSDFVISKEQMGL